MLSYGIRCRVGAVSYNAMSIAEEESGNPLYVADMRFTHVILCLYNSQQTIPQMLIPVICVIRATVTSQCSVRCVTRLISQAARRQESARENGAFVSKSFSRYFSIERQTSKTKSEHDIQFLTDLRQFTSQEFIMRSVYIITYRFEEEIRERSVKALHSYLNLALQRIALSHL